MLYIGGMLEKWLPGHEAFDWVCWGQVAGQQITLEVLGGMWNSCQGRAAGTCFPEAGACTAYPTAMHCVSRPAGTVVLIIHTVCSAIHSHHAHFLFQN